WGTNSNELLLHVYGIPYTVRSPSELSVLDLGQFAHIIVAADQPTGFYQELALHGAQIAAWVSAGGVLEFHTAGWGFNGGDASLVTLPGGVGIYQRLA